MHPQSWTGKLFALYCLSLQEAQAGVDVHQAPEGDRDIRKTVGLRLYLMMERISTWSSGTGAGLLSG
jgi:hypothetical protein